MLLPLIPVALIAVVAMAASSRRGSSAPPSPSPSPPAPPPTCDARFSALHKGGKRALSGVRVIVLHSTEGSTAAGAAGWFADPRSGGSAHLVVDDTACFRTLPDDVIPWGAQGVNTDGLHLEVAGFAKWTRAEWMAHEARITRAAQLIAAWCRQYGIPARLLTAAELKAGARGITTHATAVKVYGGDHSDPGAGFPLDVLLERVRGELGEGGAIA